MKKIKINFCKYDPKDECSYSKYIINILKKYYDVGISDNPDYLFFNQADYENIKYNNAIKIFYTGENIHPNFNNCDYAIGFDYLNLGDRYFRLPIYYISTFYREKELDDLKNINLDNQRLFSAEDLGDKEDFCSFVYSNYKGSKKRREIFEKLNEYKKVNSGGAFLNNTGKRIENKLEFEKKHKFSIAFENSSNDGYTTEKIINSVMAQTIPIYWGNPKISDEFNDKRFINCHKYNNFDEVLEEVKKIDQDNELYLEMINQPLYDKDSYLKVEKDFELFLKNIFDQPIEKAGRIKINQAIRSNLIKDEKILLKINLIKNFFIKLLSTFYKPFKKIGGIDKFKQRFLNKNIK